MKYKITVECIDNKVYQFLSTEEVTNNFADFVEGKNKEQFFKFIAQGNRMAMISRKAILYVLIEPEEGRDE